MARRALLAACLFLSASSLTTAGIIYESGTLGATGLAQGTVDATNISPYVFTGVRFQLSQPVVTTQVGGHFVSTETTTFFGAIVELDNANDFPDSGDLSTPDVLGSTTLNFPVPSDEVFGNLNLNLSPGWYALVFGAGLFGTNGDGVAPRNNPDIGSPEYIAYQRGTSWRSLEGTSIPFDNHRFVIHGSTVPEPSALLLAMFASGIMLHRRCSI